MKPYILFIRKVHTETLTPLKEYTNADTAEEAGNHIYITLNLDTIVVAEAWFDYALGKVCYKMIYKRIRTCKHPQIQGDMFEGGMVCCDCKLLIRKLEPVVIVSKVEDIKEEAIDPEDILEEEEDEGGFVDITEQYNLQHNRKGT
jgi:hypothetical protein